MHSVAQTLSINLLAIVVGMGLLWFVATARRNVSIIDAWWGVGFVVVAWLSTGLNAPIGPQIILLDGLVTLWGLRLSLYIAWRNWGAGEDHRYAAMRARRGSSFWWFSLFSVFLLQGLILWFVSLPIQLAAAKSSTAPLGWLDGLGGVIWTVGICFETVGDWQLARFKADPGNAGRVLDRGLWRYTRHPNYFGDFCVWWGLYAVASAGGALPTVASPVLMSLLLMKVSGVTLLESTVAERRPDYLRYKRQTNAFFPGPPKSVA